MSRGRRPIDTTTRGGGGGRRARNLISPQLSARRPRTHSSHHAPMTRVSSATAGATKTTIDRCDDAAAAAAAGGARGRSPRRVASRAAPPLATHPRDRRSTDEARRHVCTATASVRWRHCRGGSHERPGSRARAADGTTTRHGGSCAAARGGGGRSRDDVCRIRIWSLNDSEVTTTPRRELSCAARGGSGGGGGGGGVSVSRVSRLAPAAVLVVAEAEMT